MLEDPSSRLNVIITISTAIVVGPLPALQIVKLLHVLKEKVPVWASAAAAEVKLDAWLAGPPKPNCRLFERQLTSLVRAGQPTARCSQTVFFFTWLLFNPLAAAWTGSSASFPCWSSRLRATRSGCACESFGRRLLRAFLWACQMRL